MSWAKQRAAELIEREERYSDEARWRIFAAEQIRAEKGPFFRQLIEQIETYTSEFCQEYPSAKLRAKRNGENCLIIGPENAIINKTEVVFDPDRAVITVERTEGHPLSGLRARRAEVRLMVDRMNGKVTTDAGDLDTVAQEILGPVIDALSHGVL